MKLFLCLLFAVASSFAFGGSLQDKISGDLVRLDGDALVPASDALDGKDVIAVYYSAHWCPPCRQFTPQLSEFYDQASEEYPNFQMIFMSSDRGSDAMEEYMEWGKMNFPAVSFDERQASGLGEFSARGIPYLVVLDGDGNQILGKAPGEDYKSPYQTLEELNSLLASQ
ncbi:MAG: thioredoxin-like domain-containing protein [Verrucomicrobiota bacterium]